MAISTLKSCVIGLYLAHRDGLDKSEFAMGDEGTDHARAAYTLITRMLNAVAVSIRKGQLCFYLLLGPFLPFLPDVALMLLGDAIRCPFFCGCGCLCNLLRRNISVPFPACTYTWPNPTLPYYPQDFIAHPTNFDSLSEQLLERNGRVSIPVTLRAPPDPGAAAAAAGAAAGAAAAAAAAAPGAAPAAEAAQDPAGGAQGRPGGVSLPPVPGHAAAAGSAAVHTHAVHGSSSSGVSTIHTGDGSPAGVLRGAGAGADEDDDIEAQKHQGHRRSVMWSPDVPEGEKGPVLEGHVDQVATADALLLQCYDVLSQLHMLNDRLVRAKPAYTVRALFVGLFLVWGW